MPSQICGNVSDRPGRFQPTGCSRSASNPSAGRGYAGVGLLLVFILTGCGSGRRTYAVDGEIHFSDGQPAVELVGGSVEFDLIGGKTSARGRIDSEGHFTMTTFKPNDGALPGKHRVLIMQPVMTADAKNPPADVIDRKYRTYDTSQLEVTVEEKRNRVTLTVERGKPRPPGEAPRGR